MKILLCLMVCILLLVANASAQESDSGSVLQSLVDAERAFARASEEKGTREAFLAFIADDGILFRPAAVNGKKWLLEHPLPPSQKRPLLAWQPSFADVASAGDMGYTFGPWEFKEDIKDQKPMAYGNFITVWKWQTDGSWKFAIDLGVSHAEPKDAITPWQFPANYKQNSWKPTKGDVEPARQALLNRDREFSSASSRQGPLKSFLAYSGAGVRLFRNNHFPFVGSEDVREAFSEKKQANERLTWQPIAGDVSSSGDLGYTHGIYIVSSGNDPQKISERGNYMRIWKKLDGVWKVMADVADPLPPETQKN